MKRFVGALISSLCIQTAILASYLHYPAAAALLWIVAAIVIFQNYKAAGGGLRRRTRRRLRDALATIILVSGLLRFFILRHPFGGGDQFTAPAPNATSKNSAANATTFDNSGDHTGIILLPEQQEHVTLVAPLPSMPNDLFDQKHQHPLSIPFYGAYWFFKFPDTKPPPNSYVTHGTPAEMTFFAPDSRPLMMEAHQNLGKLIDLACCREIQIEIQNADHYPGTVSVELTLVNTREGQEGSASLGTAPVTSEATTKETLSFRIPTHPSIRQFDELMIRFPRRRPRISRSAKVAINRFILIPRA